MLSVLSLPDAERAEACATDPRARAIVERAERFGAGELTQLHAATLYHAKPAADADRDPVARDPHRARRLPGNAPCSRAATRSRTRRPRSPAIDVPGIDCVFVDGVKVSKGSAVRLHPKRRADAWKLPSCATRSRRFRRSTRISRT